MSSTVCDTAPTRVVASVEGPGVQFSATSPCGVKQLQPELFAVGPAPYTKSTEGNRIVTIDGANFGPTAGTVGRVEFTPESPPGKPPVTPIRLPVVSWTDNQIRVRIGHSVVPTGPGMLHVIREGNDLLTGCIHLL